MSKRILAFAFSIYCMVAVGQNINYQTAYKAFNNKELDRAKKAIDLAIVHEETKTKAKVWLCSSQIYNAIVEDKGAFKNLDPDAAEKAYTSAITCLKLDKDKIYTDAIDLMVTNAGRVYNQAAAAYNAQNFEKALQLFNMLHDGFAFDTNKSLQRNNNISHESLTFDEFTCASAAGNNTKAKELLQKLIDSKYKDPNIYLEMARLKQLDKDTSSALKYIESGRSLFEDNNKLITAELDIYIRQGKLDLLLEKTRQAIEVAPDNELLHYVQGKAYEQKGSLDKAETSYIKAIELKPDYLDPNRELGIIYFNRGGEWNKKAEQLPPSQLDKVKQYDAKAQEEFKKALPYLEKSFEIDPSDKSIAGALQYVYRLNGDTEKLNKMKEKKQQKK